MKNFTTGPGFTLLVPTDLSYTVSTEPLSTFLTGYMFKNNQQQCEGVDSFFHAVAGALSYYQGGSVRFQSNDAILYNNAAYLRTKNLQ